MEKRDFDINDSPTIMEDGRVVWEIPDSGDSPAEREPNDGETMEKRSPNDGETMEKRSQNDGRTMAKRCFAKVGTFLQRLAQTANATRQRQQALKAAKETPKSKIYPDVWAWLDDDRNIQEASNYVYSSVDDLTDNTPDCICNALNDLGFVPKDKPSALWNPTSLSPIVFHLRIRRRYSKQAVVLMNTAWMMALVVVVGFFTRTDSPKPIAPSIDTSLSAKEIVQQWEDKNHYYFSPWRRDSVIMKQEHITTEFLNAQAKAQGKSFDKPKGR